MNEQTGLTRVARALLGCSPARLEPADQARIEAIEAEMDTIDGTLAQLEWAAVGLRLLWTIGRRDMTAALRFWIWVSCHGAVLSFMVLTSALPDRSIVPVTLLFCGTAGLLTGLWAGRVLAAGMAGGTTALIGASAFLLAAGVTHRASLDTPWPLIIAALAVTLPTFAGLGFVAGALGGAIASPIDAVRSLGHAAEEGPRNLGEPRQ